MTNPTPDNSEVKLCECGCGQPAPIAPQSNTKLNWKKGEPLRFVYGHSLSKCRPPIKHGYKPKGGSPEYSAFCIARNRCNNKKNKSYPVYGGRGIKFLFKDFVQFIEEIGPKPDPNYSLDRIDNDGHYAPGNVRWASRTTQNRNQRRYKDREWERPEIPLKGTVVRLTWLDSTSVPGWHYFHEGEKVDTEPRIQVSYGTIVGIGLTAITIAGTVSPRDLNIKDSTEGLMDLLIVPKGCLIKVEVLS